VRHNVDEDLRRFAGAGVSDPESSANNTLHKIVLQRAFSVSSEAQIYHDISVYMVREPYLRAIGWLGRV
jgi:hypothetical protein